ncbi:hypothetical protein [Nocardia asiatica]|uniref:hypothetical protein n=1 Tax=Nocardia asiatica TaxID=209252 RepID=UPI001FE1E6A6|nr:hypothetical protein [Nocardia asiatica]
MVLYGVGAQISRRPRRSPNRLITDNPAKYGGLEGYGLELVGRVTMPVSVKPHNLHYCAQSVTGWVRPRGWLTGRPIVPDFFRGDFRRSPGARRRAAATRWATMSLGWVRQL